MARQYYKDSTTGQMKPLGVKVEDTLPVGFEGDIPDGTPIPEGWVEVDKYTQLGVSNNANITITLSNDKLSNYKYIFVQSGYGGNLSSQIIPISIFSLSTTINYRQYVKTYNSYGFTSVRYIDDTHFNINGAVTEMPSSGTGTDTLTRVYGIR
jgi:hypothetical protein